VPVIETASPLGAAADAVGGYLNQKRENDLQAQAREMALQQAAQQQHHQQFEENRETAGDAAAAKAEAATELHQQRDDAIRAAQLELAATKDQHDYQIKVRQINLVHEAAMAKLKNDRTVAEIHASATLGAAQIHAAATITAAGISSGGASDRQLQREQFDLGTGARTYLPSDDVAAVIAKGRTGQMKPMEVYSYIQKHVADPAQRASLLMQVGHGTIKTATAKSQTFQQRLASFMAMPPPQQAAAIKAGLFTPSELKQLSTMGGGTP